MRHITIPPDVIAAAIQSPEHQCSVENLSASIVIPVFDEKEAPLVLAWRTYTYYNVHVRKDKHRGRFWTRHIAQPLNVKKLDAKAIRQNNLFDIFELRNGCKAQLFDEDIQRHFTRFCIIGEEIHISVREPVLAVIDASPFTPEPMLVTEELFADDTVMVYSLADMDRALSLQHDLDIVQSRPCIQYLDKEAFGPVSIVYQHAALLSAFARGYSAQLSSQKYGAAGILASLPAWDKQVLARAADSLDAIESGSFASIISDAAAMILAGDAHSHLMPMTRSWHRFSRVRQDLQPATKMVGERSDAH